MLSPLNPSALNSCTMAGRRFTGTIANDLLSSIATPPQAAPPMFPGTTSDPSRDGGVKGPSFRRLPNSSRQAACASGVGPQASFAEYCRGDSGGVTVVNGWVGLARSPGTLLAGTGRSSTGKTGFPVVRSSTYIIPVLG